jgi:hypothetical protein
MQAPVRVHDGGGEFLSSTMCIMKMARQSPVGVHDV